MPETNGGLTAFERKLLWTIIGAMGLLIVGGGSLILTSSQRNDAWQTEQIASLQREMWDVKTEVRGLKIHIDGKVNDGLIDLKEIKARVDSIYYKLSPPR